MTLDEIKQALDDGHIVHWGNNAYVVFRNDKGELMIKYKPTNFISFLTDMDGDINGYNADDFYIADTPLDI